MTQVCERVNASTTTTSRLPRVLYVVVMDPSQKFGSMEEQMAILAREFQAEGSLFLPLFNCANSPGQPTPLEREGVTIACLDMRRFRWRVLVQLLRLVREHQIDIVHWNFSPPISNSYLWWLAVLQPGVKHFYTDHISREASHVATTRGWKRRLKRFLLGRYAKVMCVSQFIADCLHSDGTWSNIVCCRHFINTDRFRTDLTSRTTLRNQFQVNNRFVLLAVAHLIKAKGIDVAIRALAQLPEDVVLWVIGTGVEAERLQDLARDLGLDHRVIFHGPQKQVEPFMQAADCLVCPSLWAEAAGLVNLEAQASGIPVIASDIGGIPEYVADGQTGFLFPAGNAHELANRVGRLINEASLRRRFSETARMRVEDEFSPAARLPEFINFYRSSC